MTWSYGDDAPPVVDVDLVSNRNQQRESGLSREKSCVAHRDALVVDARDRADRHRRDVAPLRTTARSNTSSRRPRCSRLATTARLMNRPCLWRRRSSFCDFNRVLCPFWFDY